MNLPDDDMDILDAMLNSYAQGLADTIVTIDSLVMAVPCMGAAEAVHAVLNTLKARLQQQIDEIDACSADDEDEDESPPELPDHLLDALSAFFGADVKFVRLEPSAG